MPSAISGCDLGQSVDMDLTRAMRRRTPASVRQIAAPRSGAPRRGTLRIAVLPLGLTGALILALPMSQEARAAGGRNGVSPARMRTATSNVAGRPAVHRADPLGLQGYRQAFRRLASQPRHRPLASSTVAPTRPDTPRARRGNSSFMRDFRHAQRNVFAEPLGQAHSSSHHPTRSSARPPRGGSVLARMSAGLGSSSHSGVTHTGVRARSRQISIRGSSRRAQANPAGERGRIRAARERGMMPFAWRFVRPQRLHLPAALRSVAMRADTPTAEVLDLPQAFRRVRAERPPSAAKDTATIHRLDDMRRSRQPPLEDEDKKRRQRSAPRMIVPTTTQLNWREAA